MNDFWSLNEATFYCLYDRKRTLAFKRAISKTIKPGDVVVELGAGTGILSMFAADRGAKLVYAIELDKNNVRCLRQTVDSNGYAGVIKVIEADVLSVKMPEKVDVVICEMIATGLIEELQVPAMNHILKYAKKGARVLLAGYNIKLDLVQHKNVFYGKSMHTSRFEFPDKYPLRSSPLTRMEQVAYVDFTKKVLQKRIDKEYIMKVTKSGVVNGMRISGETTFSDGSTFGHSIAYSFPLILPVQDQKVVAGELFHVNLSYVLCGGPQHLRYHVEKMS